MSFLVGMMSGSLATCVAVAKFMPLGDPRFGTTEHMLTHKAEMANGPVPALLVGSHRIPAIIGRYVVDKDVGVFGRKCLTCGHVNVARVLKDYEGTDGHGWTDEPIIIPPM